MGKLEIKILLPTVTDVIKHASLLKTPGKTVHNKILV